MTASETDARPDPAHVAIIMDGNGRWARRQGKPRLEGHRQGAETVRRVLRAARRENVRTLTLYAFSVENWRRPEDEIAGLWQLLERFLSRHLNDLLDQQIRLRVLGRIEGLPARIRDKVAEAMARTAHFPDYTCNVALNYGARTEAVDAARAFARDCLAGRASPEALEWEDFAQYLYTAGQPDPDLLIRTSGEYRISNYLLLQLAYAELYFTEKLWPEFTEEDFAQALAVYRRRERRYGLTGEQLKC